MLVADHNSAESAALQVRAMPVYEKPPARLVDGYLCPDGKKEKVFSTIIDKWYFRIIFPEKCIDKGFLLVLTLKSKVWVRPYTSSCSMEKGHGNWFLNPS